MVECEYFSKRRGKQRYSVLIDTWWNVNGDAWYSSIVGKSFNRYMVECEYHEGSIRRRCQEVLIDTWWNVNDNYK